MLFTYKDIDYIIGENINGNGVQWLHLQTYVIHYSNPMLPIGSLWMVRMPCEELVMCIWHLS